jgi:RNA polymerase sigma factor (sigma-70 family)
LPASPTAFHATFPTTHWTVILNSVGPSSANGSALEALCKAYWEPLYVFICRKGIPQHDAQDLVQGFICRLLERGDLATVSPEKGRFRTYLLTALRNFIIKEAEHHNALKRGGGKVFVSIDAEDARRLSLPDSNIETPELAFDRQWARTTLARALRRLRDEHLARKKEEFFETLSPFLEGAEPDEYKAAGLRLGMKSGTVAVTVHRMRRRLKELVRAEVLQTVGNSADADAEVRELLEALSRQ